MANSIYFMHIPKTAGTSFKHALIKNFDSNEIFPSKRDINKNSGRYPNIERIEKKKLVPKIQQAKLFYGHYPLHIYNRFELDKDLKITFLRDPIRRTISHLKHLKRYNPLFKGLSLEEIFEFKDFRVWQFDNLQTRYFLMGTPNYNLNFSNLKTAKNNLLKFDFVGITENYRDSLKLFENRFDISIEYLEHNKLSTSKTSSSSINEEFFLKIYDSNRLDIELYNFAKQKLEEESKFNAE